MRGSLPAGAHRALPAGLHHGAHTARHGAVLLATVPAAKQGQLLRLTSAERIGSAVVLVVLGVVTILLGRYGWRKGAALVPRTTAEHQVPHRAAVLRRGAMACMVAGVMVVLAAVAVATG